MLTLYALLDKEFMKTKTFENMLLQNAEKQDLKDLIKMAEKEVEEWDQFIIKCYEKLKGK